MRIKEQETHLTLQELDDDNNDDDDDMSLRQCAQLLQQSVVIVRGKDRVVTSHRRICDVFDLLSLNETIYQIMKGQI